MRQIIILITILTFASSCKKNETPAASKTDLLCFPTWVVDSITVSPPLNMNGTMVTNVKASLPICETDDSQKFNSNKTYNVKSNSRCIGDTSAFTGTWNFLDSESKISTMDMYDTSTYNIISLEGGVMKLTETQTFPQDSTVYTFRYVLKAKQ